MLGCGIIEPRRNDNAHHDREAGDIELFSANGDISAGAGAKTYIAGSLMRISGGSGYVRRKAWMAPSRSPP
jgi:hypothetical protein